MRFPYLQGVLSVFSMFAVAPYRMPGLSADAAFLRADAVRVSQETLRHAQEKSAASGKK